MNITSKHFGEIQIDEDKVIFFDEGLPGFENLKEFVLLNEDKDEKDIDEKDLFWWLQSVEDGDVAFVLINTFLVMPDYDPQIRAEDMEGLGEYNIDKLLIFNIVVVPKNISNMSANMRAPVIINPENQKGKQIITLNEDYSIKHLIMNEIKNGRQVQ